MQSYYFGVRDSAAERYQTDPAFRALVDTLTSCVERGQYSCSELREACILAAIRVESWTIRTQLIDTNDISIERRVMDALKPKDKECNPQP
jgi:hypothetical protein